MMCVINDVLFKMYKSCGLFVVGEFGLGKFIIVKMIVKMYVLIFGVIEYKGCDI